MPIRRCSRPRAAAAPPTLSTQELTSQARQRVSWSPHCAVHWSRGNCACTTSRSTTCAGSISGFEALVRWQHPEKGLISPAVFIPIAEETGLISAIDHWFSSRPATGPGMARPGSPTGFIAVNISSRLFGNGDPTRRLPLSRQQRAGSAPSGAGNHRKRRHAGSGRCTELLQRLRTLGVQLAIDDFGTGYSSLQRLKRMNVHQLKIDRGFVRGLPADREDAAITRSVIGSGT